MFVSCDGRERQGEYKGSESPACANNPRTKSLFAPADFVRAACGPCRQSHTVMSFPISIEASQSSVVKRGGDALISKIGGVESVPAPSMFDEAIVSIAWL